jgi:hypothetical protein
MPRSLKRHLSSDFPTKHLYAFPISPMRAKFPAHLTFHDYFFLWLYSTFWTLAASHTGGFLNYFRHMVGLLRRVISPSQGLYLHTTTQHRKTRTDIHNLSWTRTHDSSNQPAKTHASDRTATVTGHP